MATSLLPVYFRKSGEGATANYDFYDFASRTGYKTFYGTKVYAGASAGYGLVGETNVPCAVNAADPYTDYANAAADVDFDFTFNMPTVVQGTAYVSIPVLTQHDGGAGAVSTDMTIKIYHVAVGGAETQLGTTASMTVSQDAGSTTYYHTFSAKATIPTTSFSPGQSIRITITGSSTGDANHHFKIYHDPSERYNDATVLSTKLMAVVPFRIDL